MAPTLPTPTNGETVVAAPPAAVPVTPDPNPQQAGRNAVYEKYDQLYGQAPPQVPPIPEPQQPTPVVAAPVTVAPPETESLKTRIAELERQLAKPVPTAPLPPVDAGTPASWEDLLLTGKLKEAKEALVKEVQAKIAAENSPGIVREAVEVSEAKAQISQFLTTLRTQNPDLASMERYLTGPVNMRMEEIQKAGKITSPADYAKHYMASVEAEIDELRKIKQQFVSAGREEASVRQREVLSSTPIPPNPVEQRGSEGAGPEATPSDPNLDYFAKRAERARAIRHLS